MPTQTLLRIKDYQKTLGPNPPHMNTLYRWAANGELPTVTRGKLIFVIIDQAQQQTGNPLVDGVLAAR